MIVRRGLPLLSLLLVFVGLEMATGGISDALARVARVADSLASGEPVGVYLPAYFLGLLLVVAGFAGLGASAWSRVTRGRIPVGTACPECGSSTNRIRRKVRHRILARLLDEKIQRRYCEECRWKGVARVR